MGATKSIPQQTTVYEKSSVMATTMEKMQAFHESQDAFSKLVPPPMIAQLREDNRTSNTEGDLKFTLWMGPIPIKWHAQHQAGPIDTSFADLMVDGPMEYWRHEHIFEAVTGGIQLTDRVTLAHKSGFQGILTRLMFDGLPLRFLFFYRHLRTKWAVEA
ncbi:MAG: hypothetical protein WBC91_23195 [Phototrophicaceae bacterium]